MIYFWFDKFKAERASHRLRAKILVDEFKFQEIESNIINFDNLHTVDKDNSIIIFSKDSLFVNMIKVKESGYTVGFDLCDNKFLEEKENYNNFCRYADFITVNSKVMQEVVFKETGRNSYRYDDVVERVIQKPNIPLNNELQLLWYGGSSSRAYMPWNEIIELLDNNIKYKLHVCSNKIDKWKSKIRGRIEKNHPEAINDSNLVYHEWTYDLQDNLMDMCDIILIPVHDYSDKAKRRTITKSHNRLTDGIAKGKWVISTPLESYKPLKEFCWLDDILSGIRFYQSKPDQVKEKILNGQQWIQQNASSKVVTKQLLKIYESVKK